MFISQLVPEVLRHIKNVGMGDEHLPPKQYMTKLHPIFDVLNMKAKASYCTLNAKTCQERNIGIK